MFRRRGSRSALCLLVALVQVASLASPIMAASASCTQLALTGQGDPLVFRVAPRAVTRSVQALAPATDQPPADPPIAAPRQGTLQSLSVKVSKAGAKQSRKGAKGSVSKAHAVSSGEFRGQPGSKATGSTPKATVQGLAKIKASAPKPAPKRAIKDVVKISAAKPLSFHPQANAPASSDKVVRKASAQSLPVQHATGKSAGGTSVVGKSAKGSPPSKANVSGGKTFVSGGNNGLAPKAAKIGAPTDLGDSDAKAATRVSSDASAKRPLGVTSLARAQRPGVPKLVPVGGATRVGGSKKQGAGVAGNAGGLCDLTLDLSVTPASVLPGQTFTVVATPKNIGHGASQDTAMSIYLSNDATTPGQFQDATSVASLPPGSSDSTYQRDFQAPANAGTYYIVACVQNVTDEVDLANNVKRIPLTVTQGKPDLAVQLALDKAAVDYGDPLEVDFTVQNLGDGATAGSKLHLTISPKPDCSGATPLDPSETSIDVPAMDVGESSDQGFRIVKFGRSLAPGNYTICAAVDAVEGETQLANNTASASFQIKQPIPPDLQAQIKLESDSVEACGTTTADVVITNVGQGQASAVEARFVQASSADLSSANVNFKYTVGPLAPGASVAKRFPVQIPCGTAPQTIFLGIQCDQAQDEVNLANNQDSKPLCVMKQGQPDLAATIVSLTPAQVRQGESFNCLIQIQNIGKKPANGTRYEVDLVGTTDASQHLRIDAEGLPGLAPGQMVSTDPANPLVVQIPNSMRAGSYKVTLDVLPVPEEKTPDDLTANNHAEAPVTITEQTRPDLAVSLSLSDHVVKAGGSLTANMMVTNVGNKPAPASNLSLTLGQTDSGAGSIISSAPTPVLNPGDTLPVAVTVAIRGDAPLGQYYLVSLVAGVTGEVNLANNRSADSIQVKAGDTPELAVAMDPPTGKTCPGASSYIVHLTTSNTGSGPSPATRGHVVVGRSKDLSDGVEIWSGAVPAIAPGGSAASDCTLQYLQGADPGTYQVAFTADPVAGEKDLSNNRVIGSVEVCDPGRPDLAITIAIQKTVMQVTDAEQGTIEIQNVGPAAAPAGNASLYLHTQPQLGAGDGTPMATFQTPALPAGATTGKIPFTLKFDPSTGPGVYFLFALVDPVTGELDLANNRAFRSIAIVQPAPPDLAAKLTLQPHVVRGGVQIDAHIRIENDGPSPAPASTYQLVYSLDPKLAGSTTIDHGIVPALGPGGFVEKDVMFATANDAAPGNYTAAVTVAVVPRETKTSNNTAKAPFNIQPGPNPDLAITITLDAPSVVQGGNLTGRVTIANVAQDAPAPAGKWHLRLARDKSGSDSRDVTGSSGDVPALNAGESVDYDLRLAVASTQDAGTYTILADVDPVRSEVLLINNHDQTPIIVQSAGLPDLLAVLKLDVDHGFPGDVVHATMTVTNVGFGCSGDSTGRLVLATHSDLSDATDLLAKPLAIPCLGHNEGDQFTQVFKIDPAAAAQTYYVGWIVAPVPRETNLANNTDTKSIDVKVVPKSDLVARVAGLSPDPIGRQEKVLARLEIANAGTATSPASTAKLSAATKPDFSDAVVLENNVAVPALDAGQAATGAREYLLDCAPDATALVYFRLEAAKVANEDRVDNNADTASVHYQSHLYNLKVQFTADPARNGKGVKAAVRVSNDGPFAAPASTLHVALSPANPAAGATVDFTQPVAGEKGIIDRPVDALNPGDSRDFPIDSSEDISTFRSVVARIDAGLLDTNPADNADGRLIPGFPRLVVSPSPVEFIAGHCRGIRERLVQVCNIGDVDLMVDKVSKQNGKPWFQMDKDRPGTISAGGCAQIDLTLVQTALGKVPDSDLLVFSSNDPNQKSLAIPVDVQKGESSDESQITSAGKTFVCEPPEVKVVAGTCRDISDFQLALALPQPDGGEVRADAYAGTVWSAAGGHVDGNKSYCAPASPGDDKITINWQDCSGNKLTALLLVKVVSPPGKTGCFKVDGLVKTHRDAGVAGVQIDGLPGGAVLTQADGTYSVACVPPGEYTLVASLPMGHPALQDPKAKIEPPQRTLKVTDSDAKVEPFTLVLPSEGNGPGAKCKDQFTVTGHLKDDKGAAARGHKIRAVLVDAAGAESAGSDEITVDTDGAFTCVITSQGQICSGKSIAFKIHTPDGTESGCEPAKIDIAKDQDNAQVDCTVTGAGVTLDLPCAGAHLIAVPCLLKGTKEGEFRKPTAFDLWQKIHFSALIQSSYMEGQRRMVFTSVTPRPVRVHSDAADQPALSPENLKTVTIEPGQGYIVIVPCAVKAHLGDKPFQGECKLKLRKGFNLVGVAQSKVDDLDAKDLLEHCGAKTLLRLGCSTDKSPFERVDHDSNARGQKLDRAKGYLIDCPADVDVDMAGVQHHGDE